MNEYQNQQLQAHRMVCRHLDTLPSDERRRLEAHCRDYLKFRRDVSAFLARYFSAICTRTCFRSRLSACCSREGIVTFFADVVVNGLHTSRRRIETLQTVLAGPPNGFKCIYLGPEGCRWAIKPLVCEMFLCDRAQEEIFSAAPEVRKQWERLRATERRFRWPDRPVLFDELETVFIQAGFDSPLMYLHNSPGLLRVKKRAALGEKGSEKSFSGSKSKSGSQR